MTFKIIISCIILIGGLGYIAYDIINKPPNNKTAYYDLKHCKVSKEWEEIRDRAWNKASTLLSVQGIKPITKCKKITIESGVKFNPKEHDAKFLEKVSRKYIDAFYKVLGQDKDIPAPDVYTNPQTMSWMLD